MQTSIQIPIIELQFFGAAMETAKDALCRRDHCGATVVLDGQIIGSGYNGPPLDDIRQRMCHIDFPVDSKKPKSDRTCCVHAEWRAIAMAQKNRPDLRGSILYFTRINENGRLVYSGLPYCTVCSRAALDAGISFWALWHKSGPRLYGAKLYNDLSYQFHLKNL